MSNSLRVLGWLFIAAGAFGLLNALGFQWIETHDGFWNACDSRELQGIEFWQFASEGPSNMEWGYWPLGVVCTWPLTDGSTLVTYEPDWTPTLLAYGLGLVGLAGIVMVAAAAVNDARPTSSYASSS